MAERTRETGGVVKRIKPTSTKVRSVFATFLNGYVAIPVHILLAFKCRQHIEHCKDMEKCSENTE